MVCARNVLLLLLLWLLSRSTPVVVLERRGRVPRAAIVGWRAWRRRRQVDVVGGGVRGGLGRRRRKVVLVHG